MTESTVSRLFRWCDLLCHRLASQPCSDWRSRAVLARTHQKKARDAFASHASENSRGGTRTRDPGIMRVGSFPLKGSLPSTASNTELAANARFQSGFGAAGGSVERAVETDDQACGRVPESLPSRMGADRQRAAGTASGWGESLSRVRPNQRLSGGGEAPAFLAPRATDGISASATCASDCVTRSGKLRRWLRPRPSRRCT